MNKPEDSTLLNVCIIPDDQVANKCVELSQSLKSDNTLFVLGEGLFPHMTVYMARFSNNAIQKVISSTEAALSQITAFRCEHTGYFMTAGRYFEASYKRSLQIMGLHKLLITHNAGLRINPGKPFTEGYFAPYTNEQQKNAEETGYDLAHNLYRPHITLTRYREGGVPKTRPTVPSANLSFEAKRICIYKADDNGAVYKLLHEMRIAGN